MKNKILKAALLGGMAVLVPIALQSAVPANAYEAHEQSESEQLSEFLEQAYRDQVTVSPQSMTYLRIVSSEEMKQYTNRLDDLSPLADDRDFALRLRQLNALEKFEDAKLDDAAKLNKKLFAYQLEQYLSAAQYRFHNYPVDQLYGWHGTLMNFMTTSHALTTPTEADHYVARLRRVSEQYDGLKQQLAVRERAGIIPPTFIIDKVLNQIDDLITEDAKEQVLFTTFGPRLESIEGIDADTRTALLEDAAHVIEREVLPALTDLKAYMTALREKSNNDAGAWKHPDGAAFYKTQLEAYTTTDLTAEEIHQIGLKKVAEVQGEMKKILAAEGYDVSGDFSKLINGFAEEDRHYYPDTDEGRAQIIKDYTAMIEEIDAGIAAKFNLKPKALVEVHRVPTYIEQGAPGGYYSRPAADGSRPGRFYANLYDIKATPKFGMRALAYHEAVPGHHYQIALQQEQESLPLFRKFGGYGAYIEGWALYSEHVAFEMGFQKTPFDKIGAYQSQLYRAVRLVVDTGIHQKRWTREQAIDYMASNTGMAMSDVVTEIERYIVWPGQATGYMIGQLEILRMRDKAKEALGEKFDVRDFHDVVLQTGAVPLTILEEQVDAYIARKKG